MFLFIRLIFIDVVSREHGMTGMDLEALQISVQAGEASQGCIHAMDMVEKVFQGNTPWSLAVPLSGGLMGLHNMLQ